MFLPRPQLQDREISHAHNTTSIFYSPAEFGRRVGTPRIQLKDVVSLLVTRPVRHVGLVVFTVNSIIKFLSIILLFFILVGQF